MGQLGMARRADQPAMLRPVQAAMEEVVELGAGHRPARLGEDGRAAAAGALATVGLGRHRARGWPPGSLARSSAGCRAAGPAPRAAGTSGPPHAGRGCRAGDAARWNCWARCAGSGSLPAAGGVVRPLAWRRGRRCCTRGGTAARGSGRRAARAASAPRCRPGCRGRWRRSHRCRGARCRRGRHLARPGRRPRSSGCLHGCGSAAVSSRASQSAGRRFRAAGCLPHVGQVQHGAAEADGRALVAEGGGGHGISNTGFRPCSRGRDGRLGAAETGRRGRRTGGSRQA